MAEQALLLAPALPSPGQLLTWLGRAPRGARGSTWALLELLPPAAASGVEDAVLMAPTWDGAAVGAGTCWVETAEVYWLLPPS